MLFSSLPFLYYFLPVTLILYGLVPKNGKNLILLLTSLFFYGWESGSSRAGVVCMNEAPYDFCGPGRPGQTD